MHELCARALPEKQNGHRSEVEQTLNGRRCAPTGDSNGGKHVTPLEHVNIF